MCKPHISEKHACVLDGLPDRDCVSDWEKSTRTCGRDICCLRCNKYGNKCTGHCIPVSCGFVKKSEAV